MPNYDVAQICKNGHLITSYASESVRLEPFCSKCGSETITNCQKCAKPIKGSESEYGYLFDYTIPFYCIHCGHPYPWTELALESAKALIDEDENLNEDEKQLFSETLPDLVVDSPTPKTQLSVSRFRKFLSKVTTYTADGLKSILVDVTSEVVKKSLNL
ncbi:hypothetical protein SDC9_159140 [bioreactor metagenome]|uniref:DUF2321 domain-containing protein n=1 Tax=bioreactor metagenome TaxID=1076179 RepID=A0A645FED3_9ZZZZ